MEAWRSPNGVLRWLHPEGEDLTDWTPIALPVGVAAPDSFEEVAAFGKEYVIDGDAFVADLFVLKADKWAEVLAARTVAENSGCMTPLGRVDTTPESRDKISGAVQMAMIAQMNGAPFSIDWTMEDNSTVTHDAPAMISLGMAVGTHIDACHGVGRLKRAAIDAAATKLLVEAVDPLIGWPE